MPTPQELFASLELGVAKGIFTALLLPPVPLIVSILAGAVLISGRRRLLGWGVLLAACLALYACSTTGVARLLTHALVDPPQALTPASLASLKSQAGRREGAVIVLGAGREAHAPEYGKPNLNRLGMERLRYGVWLSRAVSWPLGFSGGVGHGVTGTVDEAGVAARIAREEFGWPLQWQEAHSRDTVENAEASVALMKQHGVRRVLLVTHGFHMRRAMRAFERAIARQGAVLEIVPAPMGLGWSEGTGGWMPSQEGLMQTRWVLREWLGWVAGA